MTGSRSSTARPCRRTGLEKYDLEQTVSKSAIKAQKTGLRTVRTKPEQMVRETVYEAVSGGPFDRVSSELDAAGAQHNGMG